MVTDETLLAALSGPADPQDLTRFVQRHQAAVYRTCLSVVRRADLAEDAAQETFVTLLRRGSTRREPGSSRGWLHRVAVNASLQLLRSERRRRQRDRHVGRQRPEAATPPAETADDEARRLALVRRKIEALPARWRLPILLRYEEGLSYAEIAAVLDCPEGTVGSRLHEGISRLKQTLADLGVVLVAAQVEAAVSTLPPHEVPFALADRLAELARGFPSSAPGTPTAPAGPSPAPLGARLVAAAAILTALTASIVQWQRAAPPPERTAHRPAAERPGTATRGAETSVPRAASEREAPAALPSDPRVAGPTGGALPAAAGLSGRVLDEDRDTPIEGAEVVLSWLQGKEIHHRHHTTRTDAQGRFAFAPVEDLPLYRLRIRAEGWAARDFDLADIVPGEPRDYRIAAAWELVVVVRGPGGEWIDEGLYFWIQGPNHGWSAAGRLEKPATATYRIAGLSFEKEPPDRTTLRISHRAYVAQTLDGFADRLHGGHRVECTVTLDAGASVQGTVRNEAGRPLAGARVVVAPHEDAARIDPREAVTDHLGAFRIPGLPNGPQVLWAEEAEHVLDRPLALDLGAGEARTLEVTLPRGGVVEGTLLLPSGEPFAEGTVEVTSVGRHPMHGLSPNHRGARTDRRGRFRVTGLVPSSEYRLDAGEGVMRLEVLRSSRDHVELRVVVRPIPARDSHVQTARLIGDEGRFGFGK